MTPIEWFESKGVEESSLDFSNYTKAQFLNIMNTYGSDLLEDRNNIEIEVRDAKFKADVIACSEYPKEMLFAFYLHWSEPDKSNKKMKFEKEPTWSLKKRLGRWQLNGQMFAANKNKKAGSYEDKLKNFINE